MLRLFGEAIFRRAFALLAVSLLTAGILFSNSNEPDKPAERLIAIGDIHGDFDDFGLLLKRVGLVDAANHWSGGTSTVVQTGDLIDRGPKGRQVMDLLMSLEKEAASASGHVLVLLGNHEVMNILGDLRYVPAEDYAAFADSESENRRKTAYQEYAAWYTSHTQLLAPIEQPKLALTEEEWMQKHPAGFLEYREAMAPEGKYGKWVRQHAALAKIGDTIFLHGGIHPNLISLKLEQVNSQISEEIAEFDKTKELLVSHKLILPFFTIQEISAAVQAQLLADGTSLPDAITEPDYHARLVKLRDFNHWLWMRDDGPLWFRGYDQWSEAEGAPQVSKVLEGYKATHVVVGHTVQKVGRIRPRFGNKVFLIDTGMLSSYYPGGRASALEICGDAKFIAVYLDQQVVLLDSTGSSPQDGGPEEHSLAGNGAKVSEKVAILPADGICSGTTAAPQ
jgi:Calcineurin-like phosphoesterase